MIDMSKISSEIKVRVKVVAGKTTLTLRQLAELHQGSILELDHSIDDGVDIYVNDVLTAKGRPVVIDGELGITITEILSDGAIK